MLLRARLHEVTKRTIWCSRMPNNSERIISQAKGGWRCLIDGSYYASLLPEIQGRSCESAFIHRH